jgi:hypothetical protein
MWAIFAVSLAGLLLEVAYTRVISYKLWYYYTYLVIGLALLGLGSGATAVVLSRRLRAADTRAVVSLFGAIGAVGLLVGYGIVALMPIDTVALWDYGSGTSFRNFGALAVICLALFLSFMPIGVIVSTLLSRARSEVNRLYFADLIGAGLGCLVVVALISRMGPPAVIMGAAAILAGTTFALTLRTPGILRTVGALLTVMMLVLTVLGEAALPELRPESSKIAADGTKLSGWGPVFRVDVMEHPTVPGGKALIHDGTWGSAIYPFEGDVDALTRFDDDPRSWPFATIGEPPGRQLIIGSAGGNEILASLYFGTEEIEAVELNPVTVDALTGEYADLSGNLAEIDNVTLSQGDGRSYLARSDGDFDLVWFVAPDSYAANNAASAGAFVLSESYLYTTDMILETLEHLSDDGISVAQFGEVDFEFQPNRTARYVVTAREALEEFGVEDPSNHIMVAVSEDPFTSGLSTIVVSPSPFSADQVDRFVEAVESTTDAHVVYAPGVVASDSPVAALAGATDQAAVDALVADYPADVTAISDDGPFFWHFSPFTDVARDIGRATTVDVREYAIGERVLLLLLATAALFAVLFLLLPFLVIRKQWRRLPAKGTSAVYFAALGLGFMLYEITMIQLLAHGHARLDPGVHRFGCIAVEPVLHRSHEGVACTVRCAGGPHDLLPPRPSVPHGRNPDRGPSGSHWPGLPGACPARAVPGHVHAVRVENRRRAESIFGRVRSVGLGNKRCLLGDRFGPHDNSRNVMGIPHGAPGGARCLRPGRGGAVAPGLATSCTRYRDHRQRHRNRTHRCGGGPKRRNVKSRTPATRASASNTSGRDRGATRARRIWASVKQTRMKAWYQPDASCTNRSVLRVCR